MNVIPATSHTYLLLGIVEIHSFFGLLKTCLDLFPADLVLLFHDFNQKKSVKHAMSFDQNNPSYDFPLSTVLRKYLLIFKG